jgi:hypothetical protein
LALTWRKEFFVQPVFTVVVYYIDNCGLNGIRINWNNKSLTHFTSHFLERYNERFLRQENLSKLELLKQFIPKNPIEVIRAVPDSDTIIIGSSDDLKKVLD